MRFEGAAFLLAVQFLTRLPVPSDGIYTPARMAASVRYYPLVGALIGALMAVVYGAAASVFSPLISVMLAMTAGGLITGAFHEDGLADMADGIGGGRDRGQALEIMRDSRLGTYGTLALVAVLALKAASLLELTIISLPGVIIAAHCASRASSVLVIATSTYVRDEGTGKPVAQSLSWPSMITALASTGLVLGGVWAAFALPISTLVSGLLGLAVGHALTRLLFERKLGGYTGDTLGAVQQLSEVGFYLGCLVWL